MVTLAKTKDDMKNVLMAIWKLCSYLFVPQWGRSHKETEE